MDDGGDTDDDVDEDDDDDDVHDANANNDDVDEQESGGAAVTGAEIVRRLCDLVHTGACVFQFNSHRAKQQRNTTQRNTTQHDTRQGKARQGNVITNVFVSPGFVILPKDLARPVYSSWQGALFA